MEDVEGWDYNLGKFKAPEDGSKHVRLQYPEPWKLKPFERKLSLFEKAMSNPTYNPREDRTPKVTDRE